jgi:hypothetical protein
MKLNRSRYNYRHCINAAYHGEDLNHYCFVLCRFLKNDLPCSTCKYFEPRDPLEYLAGLAKPRRIRGR